MALMAYAGPVDEGERAVAPLRELATPVLDMIRPMPYWDVYPPGDDSYHPTAVGHTIFLDHVDEDVAESMLDCLHDTDAAMRVVQLRTLGGAMARVPADSTAFAHRDRRVMANVGVFYDGPEEGAAREAWVRDVAARLHQRDTGAYVGFLGDEGPERVRDAYPEPTWHRLATIKARYDPDNLFRHNQNIAPGV